MTEAKPGFTKELRQEIVREFAVRHNGQFDARLFFEEVRTKGVTTRRTAGSNGIGTRLPPTGRSSRRGSSRAGSKSHSRFKRCIGTSR